MQQQNHDWIEAEIVGFDPTPERENDRTQYDIQKINQRISQTDEYWKALRTGLQTVVIVGGQIVVVSALTSAGAPALISQAVSALPVGMSLSENLSAYDPEKSHLVNGMRVLRGVGRTTTFAASCWYLNTVAHENDVIARAGIEIYNRQIDQFEGKKPDADFYPVTILVFIILGLATMSLLKWKR